MEKPWYSIFYIRSPIVKILIGILSVVAAMVVILFVLALEPDRMEAQAGNWDGRSVEKGAEIYANNCSTCHGPDGKGGAGPALNSHYFFTQRLFDVGFTGTLEHYVQLTVAAGRPSRASSQWAVMMPTWSSEFGGPLRPDQVQQVTNYVLNWEATALQQTAEQDPWIPFVDAPSKSNPEMAAAVAPATEQEGPRAPEVLFGNPPQGLGCVGCHNLNEPQTDATRGLVGPNLGNLAETAATRAPGEDASTYVHNSIINPNAHLSPGYQGNIMPAGLADRMTQEELDALVNWLLDPNRPAQ
jgi:mono/diheme cytochrome c family protein